MDGLMKYWCTDRVMAGMAIYVAIKYQWLSQTPEAMALQIVGISMAVKPLTHVVMSQMESLGLKTM